MSALAKTTNRLAILQTFIIVLAFACAPWFGFAELFSHFVPYYAGTFFLAALVGKKYWLLPALLCGAWTLLGQSGAPAASQTQQLIFYNSNTDNLQALADWQQLTKTHNPDILAFVETDLSAVEPLRDSYRYGCGTQTDGIFGMVLLAKTALTRCEVQRYEYFAYIRAQYRGTVLYVLHPPPPIFSLSAYNHGYLAAVAAQIRAETQPAVLVVGDFNQSPYSISMLKFLAASGLHSNMRNLTPTWRPFYLHIDHALSRQPAAVSVLPWLHSDHRPLRVVF